MNKENAWGMSSPEKSIHFRWVEVDPPFEEDDCVPVAIYKRDGITGYFKLQVSFTAYTNEPRDCHWQDVKGEW